MASEMLNIRVTHEVGGFLYWLIFMCVIIICINAATVADESADGRDDSKTEEVRDGK